MANFVNVVCERPLRMCTISMARIRPEFPSLELVELEYVNWNRHTINVTNFREEVVSKSSNSLARLSQSL